MKKNDAAGVEIAKLLGEGLVDIPKKGYRIAKVPVTQALWTAIMGENPSEVKGGDYPVTFVGIDRIVKFITKLNSCKEVKSAGLVFGLPSADEWKYACAGSLMGCLCGPEDRCLVVMTKGFAWSRTMPEGSGWMNCRWSAGVQFLLRILRSRRAVRVFRILMDGLGVKSRLIAERPEFAERCDKWDEMSALYWRNILIVLPKLADKFSGWAEFGPYDWVCLLEDRPFLAKYCKVFLVFDASDWERLLEAQPQLKRFKP